MSPLTPKSKEELKLAGQYLQFQDPDYAIARIAALLPKDKEK